jgi:UDP-N-acetylmuramate: L-alanyl-gamma-D-glutamyl-meso-diaminopimelate ligase
VKFYFLGICGTAMASLALLLKEKGHEVWGSDQNIYPPMSDLLRENQIEIWEGYSEIHLKKSFDLVIIGNALSRGNVEIEKILNERHPYISLPELIKKEFIHQSKSIVFTGTHGKTTTTALMSWILESAGLSPSFLIGGISKNFNSSAKIGTGQYFVIEGDEYDCAFFDKRPKFIHYNPQYLIINNIEFDHSDIYNSVEEIKDEFRKLISTIQSNGYIIANGDDENVRDVLKTQFSQLIFFGNSKNNDWYFDDVEIGNRGTNFNLYHQSKKMENFFVPLIGRHQTYNTTAVIISAIIMGIPIRDIQKGLNSFLNVTRRLELLGKWNEALVYDDFAHHPTSIRETLDSLHKVHPNKSIIAIFEPRTNTTIKNIFQRELVDALKIADNVFITPIYRKEKIPEKERLSLTRLKSDLESKKTSVELLNKYSDLIPILSRELSEKYICILLTNGNLGGEYNKIRSRFNKNLNPKT